MENPFSLHYNEQKDLELLQACLDGSGQALERLVKRHQHYIYNVALKIVLSPQDAEDVTQEVLIKMVTKLGQFRAESSFRTWLYRIVFNHVLQLKKKPLESFISTFEGYGTELEQIPDHALNEAERMEQREVIEEAKLSCMSGMLLCLNREQRLVFVLGDIFGVEHRLGGEMLSLSPDNFRQKLARARKDLYHFMNQKCGLMKEENPCRCAKKTRGFIEAGWIEPGKLKFNSDHLMLIREAAVQKVKQFDENIDLTYSDLFRAHPFQEKTHHETLMKRILHDEKLSEIFEWS